MSPTIVIYHKSDFDGIFCREIARKFLPNAELIGWEYGEPEPVIDPGDQLIILDLSVPGLMNHQNLIWIDHHKSAIEKYDRANLYGERIDGVAACRLAWQWFSAQSFDGKFVWPPCLIWQAPSKEDYIERRVTEPLAVRLAGEYDIWDRRDPNAELFQHGLRSQELTEIQWNCLLDASIHHNLGKHSPMQVSAAFCEKLLRAGEAVHYAKTQERAARLITDRSKARRWRSSWGLRIYLHSTSMD